ncbi:hypothetical protein ACH46N_17895 [Streptomyces pristinaespiralis]|jgi:hypothetical protein|uniref:Uncharacterized protein n=1 Tax=Streptomyces pristinaespiralis TaxID=38300 RepID=A0A0M4D8U3_STRPR|nr:hypothetical protein [Streptomyces pristinaespiralis]ALC20671.1 hypothetical protein SPRI_2365 [Streptomyces pristinaespiralis]QMU16501.1 hypothetical protein H3L99_25170 [Streptomyces pristinaespiralis]
MFDYAIQQLRRADLIREADAERRVPRTQRLRRATRPSGGEEKEGRVSRPDSSHFTRAA